jgi:hypothetical protein
MVNKIENVNDGYSGVRGWAELADPYRRRVKAMFDIAKARAEIERFAQEAASHAAEEAGRLRRERFATDPSVWFDWMSFIGYGTVCTEPPEFVLSVNGSASMGLEACLR